MAKTRLLFITQEMSPFLEITKISKLISRLSQAMQDKGFEIRILMPRFGNINERRNRLHEVIRLSGMNVVINGNDNALIIKVASIPSARLQVYFLDNEGFFQRKHVFRDHNNKFYEDNDERVIFFCKGAIETVKKLGWAPDIVHCHGWMTSLIPAYLKTIYKDDPTFKQSKIVYSIYDDLFTEKFRPGFMQKAMLDKLDNDDAQIFSEGTCLALHLGGVQYAEAVVLHDDDDKYEGILNHIGESSKQVLSYKAAADVENYPLFYEELLNEEVVSFA